MQNLNFFQKHLNKQKTKTAFKKAGTGQTLGGSSENSSNRELPKNCVCVPNVRIVVQAKSSKRTLGLKVEKVGSTGGTKVVQVLPNSAAESAGVLRGDLICFSGSGGVAEIVFEHFQLLEQQFVQKIEEQENSSSAPAAVLEFDLVRSAVIAAAAAREKIHKDRSKPIAVTAKNSSKLSSSANSTIEYALPPPSSSEESKAAARAAKQREKQTTSSLGYNPYEVVKSGSSLATSTTQNMSAKESVTSGNKSNQQASQTKVTEASLANDQDQIQDQEIIDEECKNALSILVQMRLRCTSEDELKQVNQSLSTMQKIITNAITKGQSEGSAGEKFRRVRLANGRIQKDILNIEGALDIMLVAGFHIVEEEETSESLLVFALGDTGPSWLSVLLKRMKEMSNEQV